MVYVHEGKADQRKGYQSENDDKKMGIDTHFLEIIELFRIDKNTMK